jgi:hypothetical protein
MKLLWTFCLLLPSVCTLAQTTTDDSKRNKYTEPRLGDFRVDIDNDGRFKTPAGTMKLMSTLKVSDLPSPSDPPLDVVTTYKCATFEALVVEIEKRDGAFGRMVPADVLAAVFPAASLCLSRNMLGINDNTQEFLIADIGAMVDAQAEVHRREYNELVDRYNALIEKHNALLTVTRSFASQLSATQTELVRQQQINNALSIYQLMPKYNPPQTINIQVTDCTRLPALCVH